jgi:hypothetical protein
MCRCRTACVSYEVCTGSVRGGFILGGPLACSISSSLQTARTISVASSGAKPIQSRCLWDTIRCHNRTYFESSRTFVTKGHTFTAIDHDQQSGLLRAFQAAHSVGTWATGAQTSTTRNGLLGHPQQSSLRPFPHKRGRKLWGLL